MKIAGYSDFTKRDLKNLRRVMNGYLSADAYVREIIGKYRGVHGSAGNSKRPCGVPSNLVNTRDPAILNTVERKVLPARLVWEFRFGPHAGFSSEDLIELHKRLFGDIYMFAGDLRPGLSHVELDGFLYDYAERLKASEPGVYAMCPVFEELLAGLLNLGVFKTGNLLTNMAFVTKIAYFWGYTCRFEDSGCDTLLRFDFSDRKLSRTGFVNVA